LPNSYSFVIIKDNQGITGNYGVKIMLTYTGRVVLRERIRYNKNHICFMPKYVVEDGNKLRKFTFKDIPKYILHTIRKKWLKKRN
jgi:hypothetical protein